MANGDSSYFDPAAITALPGLVPPPPPADIVLPANTPMVRTHPQPVPPPPDVVPPPSVGAALPGAAPPSMAGTAGDIGAQAATPSPLGPVLGPIQRSRWALTNPPGNYQQAPSYMQASTDPLTGQPSAASPSLTRLGKLLTILRGAGIGAAVGSTQPTFGTGLLAANQYSTQEAQQRMGLQAAGMNLAMQRAQLALLPEQQEFMRQQMTIAPRTDPETGQYIGNLSEKGYESYLASRNKGVGAAAVAAASRDRNALIAAKAKVDAVVAGKRFQPVSGIGLFDTQNLDDDGNPTLVPGSQQGVTISPELAQEYGIPQQYVGMNMSLAHLQAAQRMLMTGAPTLSYSRDPVTGYVTVSQRQKQMPAGVPGGPPAQGATAPPVTGGVPVVPRRAAPAGGGGGTVAIPGPYGRGGGGQADLQDTARGLVEHDTPPTTLPRRGNTYFATKAAADRYSMEHYGVPFDLAQADTDYKFSQNQNNQYMLKNMDSITEPGGALDILEKAVQGLPQMDSQTLNKVFNLTKTEFGDPAVTRFQTALLTFADKFSKVMGGGAVTDTGRQQGLDLVGAQFSKNQTAAAIDTLKQDLQAQKRGMIANNPYLKKQFGGTQGANVPPSKGGGTAAEFGQTF